MYKEIKERRLKLLEHFSPNKESKKKRKKTGSAYGLGKKLQQGGGYCRSIDTSARTKCSVFFSAAGVCVRKNTRPLIVGCSESHRIGEYPLAEIP